MINSLKLRISVIVLAVLMVLTIFVPVLAALADEDDDYYSGGGSSYDSGSYDSGSYDSDAYDSGSYDSSEDYVLDDDDSEERNGTEDSDYDEDEAYIEDDEYERIKKLIDEEDSPFFHSIEDKLRENFRKADPEGKIFNERDIVKYIYMVKSVLEENEKIVTIFTNPVSQEKDRKEAVSSYKDEMNRILPGLGDSTFVNDFLTKELEPAVEKVKELEENVKKRAFDQMNSSDPYSTDEENEGDIRGSLNDILPGLGEGEYAEKLEKVVTGSVQAAKNLLFACLECAAKKISAKEAIASFEAELNELYPGFGDSRDVDNYAYGVYGTAKNIQGIKESTMDHVLGYAFAATSERMNGEKELFKENILINPNITVNKEALGEYVEKTCADLDKLYIEVEKVIGNAIGNFFSTSPGNGGGYMYTNRLDESIEKSGLFKTIESIYPGFSKTKMATDAYCSYNKYVASANALAKQYQFGVYACRYASDYAKKKTGSADFNAPTWDDFIQRAPLKFFSAMPKVYQKLKAECIKKGCPAEYFRANDKECIKLEKVISERRAAGKTDYQPRG